MFRIGVDKQDWADVAQGLGELSPQMLDPFTYGYPGTTLMLPAIAVNKLFQIDYLRALVGSVACLISLGVATATLLCRILRPGSPWWMGTMLALSTSNLYINATPPSAVVAPFIVALVLLSLYVYENHRARERWPLILMGVLVGVAASSRLDITLLVALVQALFLWPRLGWMAVSYITIISFGVFYLTNPFMWLWPTHFIGSFADKVFFHFNNMPSSLSLMMVFKKYPFAWMGLIYGLFFVAWKKTSDFMPRIFVVYVVALSALTISLLLSSSYHPLWYFLPLVLLWETLFLFFVISLAAHVEFQRSGSIRERINVARLAQYVILALYFVLRVGVLLRLAIAGMPLFNILM